MQQLILGTKYQSYINDELVIFRLARIKTRNDKLVFIDTNNNKVSMTKQDVDKMIILEPDTILNFMITEDKEGNKDIYICGHKIDDIKSGYTNPILVTRQDIYSSSKNSFGNLNGKVFVGETMVNPSNENNDIFNSIMEFNKIIYKCSVYGYVDDKINDIINCIPNNIIKKFNIKLKTIHDNTINESNKNIIEGYCLTLKELMETTNFMASYRYMYNIDQLTFPIELGNNTNEDGMVKLNKKQIDKIQNILRCYIGDIKCIKYDKDIDCSKLIKDQHIMVSDSNYNLYLISYQVTGEMKPDNDIAQAMLNNKKL